MCVSDLILLISINVDKGFTMKDNCISQTLRKNLLSLQKIQNKLRDIKDAQLYTIYSTLTPEHSRRKKSIKSTLCVKIKNKNIRQVQFGLCVDIGCDVLDDYLYNKEIYNIHLNFYLKNLSNEHNKAYFVHNIDYKSQLTSFITEQSQLNSINLTKNLSLIQEEIKQNNKISFFIPMFESYDNYDEFHAAIENVSLKINYLE